MRKLEYVVLALAAMVATVTPAFAGIDPTPVAVPELNPTSLAGALGLVAAGVMLVRARLQK